MKKNATQRKASKYNMLVIWKNTLQSQHHMVFSLIVWEEKWRKITQYPPTGRQKELDGFHFSNAAGEGKQDEEGEGGPEGNGD